MEKKELELRMYFFVPYNISPIQQAIQAGHAALEYAYTYGGNKQFKQFVLHHKTWVILNGGTTNNRYELGTGIPIGSLNKIVGQLQENAIKYGYFQEPDLNDALTAVCFICDERVWNRVDYPDFLSYILDIKITPDAKDMMPAENIVKLRMTSIEGLIEMFPEYYEQWVTFIGGPRNLFLRELIRDKKLA
jgi:hypothetical protein